MDIQSLFNWLLNSGGAALVVSWIVEKLPSYQKLSADVKKYVYIAAVVVVGLAAYALQTYVPSATWNQIEPWLKIVAGLVVAASAGIGYHALVNTPPVG